MGVIETKTKKVKIHLNYSCVRIKGTFFSRTNSTNEKASMKLFELQEITAKFLSDTLLCL